MGINTPKIVKNILKDMECTLTELRNKKMIRDESGFSSRRNSKNGFSISYKTINDSGRIIYDSNIEYEKLIDSLLKNRQYTILLYDKSLIQAQFEIDKNKVVKERLMFIKKHNKVWEQKEINEYEADDFDWFEETSGLPIVFRVDYDPEGFKEGAHPKAHLTISNHKNCRIPIKGVVSFSEFVDFILLQFYDIKLEKALYRINDETITDMEKKLMHISWS